MGLGFSDIHSFSQAQALSGLPSQFPTGFRECRLCSILNAIPTDRGRGYRSLNRGVYYFQSLTVAFQALPLPELPIVPLSASLVRLELLSCQAS